MKKTILIIVCENSNAFVNLPHVKRAIVKYMGTRSILEGGEEGDTCNGLAFNTELSELECSEIKSILQEKDLDGIFLVLPEDENEIVKNPAKYYVSSEVIRIKAKSI